LHDTASDAMMIAAIELILETFVMYASTGGDVIDGF